MECTCDLNISLRSKSNNFIFGCRKSVVDAKSGTNARNLAGALKPAFYEHILQVEKAVLNQKLSFPISPPPAPPQLINALFFKSPVEIYQLFRKVTMFVRFFRLILIMYSGLNVKGFCFGKLC